MEEQHVNKDLILREKLALERTIMANQRTFLSFLRTALYFAIAGISVGEILQFKHEDIMALIFFILSFILLLTGIINYIKHRNKIEASKKHIGNYILDHEKD